MPYLEIATPDGARVIALARERLTFGRLPLNDVALPYAQVSRQHAELRRVGDEWWIRDLGSTNGLHIGSRRVQEHRMAPGDAVLLAPDVCIRFVAESPPRADGPRRPADSLAAFGALPRPSMAPRTGDVFNGADPDSLPALPSGPIVAGGSAHDHYRRTMPARLSPTGAVLLHICQTCGQRTPTDAELCFSCRQSIARPCDSCHRSLLPIQDRCPRCQTPNPISVYRANGRRGA